MNLTKVTMMRKEKANTVTAGECDTLLQCPVTQSSVLILEPCCEHGLALLAALASVEEVSASSKRNGKQSEIKALQSDFVFKQAQLEVSSFS